MKVAIVAPSAVPFMIGGAERLWDGLLEHFNERTPHDAELIKLPSREHNLPDLMATYESFYRLDLSHFDIVVSGKYPAWMVQHGNHRVYMLHPLRGLYDTYQPQSRAAGTPEAEGVLNALLRQLRATPPENALSADGVFRLVEDAVGKLGPTHPYFAFPGPLARELVHWLDTFALQPTRMRGHFAISRTVAERVGYFPPGVEVTATIPPSGLSGLGPGDGRHFFTASRLDRPKRLDLLIEAMRHVPAAVPLKIAGTGPDEPRLRALAFGDSRIEFVGRVTDAELAGLYRDSLAVLFVPADEDLGLVTLEAQTCGKAVITCIDSGGPTELVVDGVSGFVTEAQPEALGRAMGQLASDPEGAARMGEVGRARAARITWTAVADALLRETTVASEPLAALPRAKVVAVSTFPIAPARGGGPLRVRHLLTALSEHVDVDYVCLDGSGVASDRTIAPGIRQRVVPRSPEHQRLEGALAGGTAMPITDIADSVLWAETEALDAALRESCRGAVAVLLEHPYLLPAVLHADAGATLVYDAHNAEYLMKDELLDRTAAGDLLRRVVRAVERQAVRSSVLVVCCSDDDAASLAALGPTLAEMIVVPNGADVAGTPFASLATRRKRRAAWIDELRASGGPAVDRLALFMGSDHPPNNVAGAHICDMAGSLESVLFVLVGGHADRLVGRRLPPNILIEGVVSDERRLELLGMVDLALNPMTQGGGTNLKLVEYFAAGAPAVSTPIGARGTNAQDMIELRLAEINEFPEAIAALLAEDDAVTAKRTEAARALVERDFDWAHLGRRFAERVLEASASARRS